MRSQLKRVDGEVAALSQRIKALDDDLAKSEQYIKTATAALADAVAMEVERRKTQGDNGEDDDESSNPLSQFDAQMAVLEGKFLEAKCLASKVSNTSSSQSNNHPTAAAAVAVLKSTTAAEPPKLRRPFPVP